MPSKIIDVFASIKKSFTIRKKIEFQDMGITIEMEPMSTGEEMKILEAVKDLDGAAYVEAIKRHSLAFSIRKINDISMETPDIEYEDEQGKKTTISKYLFMLKQIEGWPITLRDVIFEAFNSMQTELDHKIVEKAKFERFTAPAPKEPEPEKTAGVPDGFKVVEEKEQTPAP